MFVIKTNKKHSKMLQGHRILYVTTLCWEIVQKADSHSSHAGNSDLLPLPCTLCPEHTWSEPKHQVENDL